MPNSGTTPDCVHCRFMVRQQDGEYRCRQHDMTLHTPIRIFCRQLSPRAEDSEDLQAWFESTLDTNKLQPNSLYTWIETTVRDAQGTQEKHIDTEVIATLTSYASWSAGTFWEVLRRVRETKREFYRQHGYNIVE